MFVEIDAVRCQGHGRCYEVAPAVFGDDDRGRGVVTQADVLPDQHAAAESAANACPEHAVILTRA